VIYLYLERLTGKGRTQEQQSGEAPIGVGS
jgi:hypothetical protein